MTSESYVRCRKKWAWKIDPLSEMTMQHIFLAFFAGMLLGMLPALFVLRENQRAKQLQDELERLKNEFAVYRGEVNQHFSKTSNLFQELTSNYRSVYEHLAQGAHSLCSEQPDVPRLDLPETKLLPDENETEWEANAGTVPPHTDEMEGAARDNPGPQDKGKSENLEGKK